MHKTHPAQRSLLRTALYAAALLLPAAATLAQSQASAPARTSPYEWVLISTQGFPDSIRRDNSSTANSWQSMRRGIAFAYNVSLSRVLGGPDWLDQRLYYITARLPATGSFQNACAESGQLCSDQLRQMYRMMLAERFSLQAHRETRLVPGYILKLGSGGAKVQLVPESTLATFDHRGVSVGDQTSSRTLCGQLAENASVTNITVTAATLQVVARYLTRLLDRPVAEQTGLQGHYSFQVTGTFTAETLPQAFRDQAGLAIEPSAIPVDVIVVDAIERPTLDELGPGTWQIKMAVPECPNEIPGVPGSDFTY